MILKDLLVFYLYLWMKPSDMPIHGMPTLSAWSLIKHTKIRFPLLWLELDLLFVSLKSSLIFVTRKQEITQWGVEHLQNVCWTRPQLQHKNDDVPVPTPSSVTKFLHQLLASQQCSPERPEEHNTIHSRLDLHRHENEVMPGFMASAWVPVNQNSENEIELLSVQYKVFEVPLAECAGSPKWPCVSVKVLCWQLNTGFSGNLACHLGGRSHVFPMDVLVRNM